MKPPHLDERYAAQWQDSSMADDYPNRPPYPDEVFAVLSGLVRDGPRRVLDAGCGTGDLARRLDGCVDAIDRSRAMIERGRALPGGARPGLRWICGLIEDAELDPPYGLVTCGESLHWFDWERAIPRLRAALSPLGSIAFIEREEEPAPWTEAVRRIVPRYSTNRDYEPYDLLEELESRGLFRLEGEVRTAPLPFAQPVAAYVAAFHSRNGLSRDRLGRERADAFDAELRRVLSPHCRDGRIELEVSCLIRHGR